MANIKTVDLFMAIEMKYYYTDNTYNNNFITPVSLKIEAQRRNKRNHLAKS